MQGLTIRNLITLAVLGIVAALTLVSITRHYREKQTVTRLKAAYSIFSQAFLDAVAENGSPENWGLSDITKTKNEDDETTYETAENTVSGKILYDNMTETLKVVKKCDAGDESCLVTFDNGYWYGGILANGIAFNFIPRSGSCTYVCGSTKFLENVCADITIDVDGPGKGKNSFGKDLFRFHISKYGIVPTGTQDETMFPFSSKCRFTTENATYGGYFGEGCSAWVIYNENMEYLHCDGLSWGGKTKCN